MISEKIQTFLEIVNENAIYRKFTYKKLVNGLKNERYKKIIVVTGTEISQIPDFRDLLDLDSFQKNPKPFYTFAKDYLYRLDLHPFSPHFFIKLLGPNLLINFTENIEGLEKKAGIDPKKVIYTHGLNVGAICSGCRQNHD